MVRLARARLETILLLLAVAVFGSAQDVTTAPPAVVGGAYEPVASGSQILTTLAERNAALAALNMAVHDYTFGQRGGVNTTLSLSMQSNGSLAVEGSGTWTSTWLAQGGPNHYWESRFAGVSSSLTTNVEKTAIPLRVSMAIMSLIAAEDPEDRQATLDRTREAKATIDGAPASCVLVVKAGMPAPPADAARSWAESEYCLDSAGLFRLASPVPGVYFLYDNSAPLQYAGRTLAGSITAVEDGVSVLQIHLTHLGSPSGADFAKWNALLRRLGTAPAPVISPPQYLVVPASGGRAVAAIIVVHALVSPQGQIGSHEFIDGGNHALNAVAWASIASRQFRPSSVQREMYALVELPASQ